MQTVSLSLVFGLSLSICRKYLAEHISTGLEISTLRLTICSTRLEVLQNVDETHPYCMDIELEYRHISFELGLHLFICGKTID
jgi:hypothetical protein